MLATKLRNAVSGSNFIDHRFWESQQVILAGSGPEQGLLAGDALRSRHAIIPVLVRQAANSSNIIVDKPGVFSAEVNSDWHAKSSLLELTFLERKI